MVKSIKDFLDGENYGQYIKEFSENLLLIKVSDLPITLKVCYDPNISLYRVEEKWHTGSDIEISEWTFTEEQTKFECLELIEEFLSINKVY